MRTAKTLNRLGGCPGWSESSLGAHSCCWVCHVATQIINHHENIRYWCDVIRIVAAIFDETKVRFLPHLTSSITTIWRLFKFLYNVQEISILWSLAFEPSSGHMWDMPASSACGWSGGFSQARPGISRFRPTLWLTRLKMSEIILTGYKTQIKNKYKLINK